jgi:hypothetical protein
MGSAFSYPSTVDVAVLHGTTEILSADLYGFYGGTLFRFPERVNVGETIDFTVGYGTDGSYLGDATAMGVAITPFTGSACDLDFNGSVDRTDLAILMNQIRAHSTNLAYDLNGDGKVDIADARWLALHFTNPGGAP